MRSTPSSVSFWTTHSGRSPLIGTNATVTGGSGAGSWRTGPVHLEGSRPRCPTTLRHRSPAGHQPPVRGRHTGSPGRRRSTSIRWWASPASRTGCRQVVDEDHGRRADQVRVRLTRRHRQLRAAGRHGQLRAERSFEKSPSACGASPRSSPRARGQVPPAAPADGRRARSGCPPRRGRRGRRGPGPADLGTPSPLQRDDRAALGPRGDGEVPVARPGCRSRRSRPGRPGSSGRARRRAGPPRCARRRGRARPRDGRTGPRWGRPGIRPGRARPGGGSIRRPRRRGCPR